LLTPAFAHCPLCTTTTGAALVVTRAYGVDDLVVGLFLGAFTISSALWINNILKKRNINRIPFQSPLIVILVLASTVASFYFAGLLSNPSPQFQIFGIDKLLFGTLTGSIISFSAFGFHKMLRNIYKRSFMPFQAIVINFIFLLFVIFSFYLFKAI